LSEVLKHPDRQADLVISFNLTILDKMKKKETKEAVYMQPKLGHKASSLILRLKKTIARTKTVKNEK
jgi:hypothetical protein